MSYGRNDDVGRNPERPVLFGTLGWREQALLNWAEWVERQLNDPENERIIKVRRRDWIEKLRDFEIEQSLKNERDDDDDCLADGSDDGDE